MTLKDQNTQAFDPVRFRYIEVLIERAQHTQVTISRRLSEKAELYMARYLTERQSAKAEAGRAIMDLGHHSQAEYLQKMYEQGQFNAVIQAAKKCFNDLAKSTTAANRIAQLTRWLNQPAAPLLGANDPLSQLIATQNSELLESTQHLSSLTENQKDFTATKHLRHKLAQQQKQNLIAQALHQGPKDPGPLNSQKLIKQAFNEIAELSPQYLEHITAYFSTIVQIEQMYAQSQSTKKK